MLYKAFLLITVGCLFSCQNSHDANQLLNQSISYHDPENNWSNFADSLKVIMESPGRPSRTSHIYIDLPNDEFYLKAIRDSVQMESLLKRDSCKLKLNGSEIFSQEEAEAYNLNCERAGMYKNYYTYLYGLPMKLRDEGTLITPVAETREFMGKTYNVVEVRYDPETGSDIWYFYFDTETHAMEVYQFFKTDDSGKKDPDSGEYIILEGMSVISGIKMPKTRTWYYNKDNKLLGADVLQ